MVSEMFWPPKFYLSISYFFALTTPRFWILLQSRLFSHLTYLTWHQKRRSVRKNLSIVLDRSPEDPAVKHLAHNTFENYGVYLIDYLQIYRVRKIRPRYLIPEERGSRYIKQALEEGRGAILITPHLGNWELGGVTFALRGSPIHALTLKDSEHKVQDFRDRMRGSIGIKSVHIDPKNNWTVLKLINLLKNNQVIAMLGDRWEGGKKTEVTFFGRKVIFPAGAVALALASGAPIIPVFTVLQPTGRYLAWMEPLIYVNRESGRNSFELITEKTQEIANIFESVITRYPDQWYNFFNYWNRYGC